MRRLVLLALVALVAFPVSAHEDGRGPRREVVLETSCGPRQRWDEARWEHRGHGWYRDDRRYRDQGWYRPHDRYDRYERYDRYDDCEGGRVVLGPLPLPPPFRGRVEWRFR